MRTATFNGITLKIAGGNDGNGSGNGPVVIFLHGYGAGGDDLVPLADEINTGKTFRYLFPAAPIVLAAGFMESRAWWMIDWQAREQQIAEHGGLDLSGEDPDGLAEVRGWLTGLIDDLLNGQGSVVGGTVDSVILGGFSQGAMLACDTALRSDLPLSGLILLSPTLLARDIWQKKMSEKSGMPVFVSHGTSDPVLPYPMSDTLQRMLTSAGMQMTWNPFTGGHEIPLPVIRRLGWFLDGC